MTGKELTHFNGKLNYTFTHLSESDIIHNYGHFRKKEVITDEDPIERQNRTQKTKMVAWVISNCPTIGRREHYFQLLRKYVQADKFSKCRGGNRRCPKKNCLEKVASEYKFYFAAENSICREYITEKVYRNSLHLGMVPIVYGGANYSQILPHKSYIDVKDFKNPKDLAAYLNKLANDDDLYNEYFAWKREYEVVPVMSDCNICEFLHRKNKEPKIYNDITKFWKTGDCDNVRTYLHSITQDYFLEPPDAQAPVSFP